MNTITKEANLALSYFGDSEGALYEAFMKSSQDPNIAYKYKFFTTNETDCAENFEASTPAVILSRNFDDSPILFRGITAEDLVAFSWVSSNPSLITFSEEYISKIFDERNPAVILFTEETGTTY